MSVSMVKNLARRYQKHVGISDSMALANELQDQYNNKQRGLVFRDLWDGNYDNKGRNTCVASHWITQIVVPNVAYNLSGSLNNLILGAVYDCDKIYAHSDQLFDPSWHYGVFYAHDANGDIRALPQCNWPEDHGPDECKYIATPPQLYGWDYDKGPDHRPTMQVHPGNPKYYGSQSGGGTGLHTLIIDGSGNFRHPEVNESGIFANGDQPDTWLGWYSGANYALRGDGTWTPFYTKFLDLCNKTGTVWNEYGENTCGWQYFGDFYVPWVDNLTDMINIQNLLWIKKEEWTRHSGYPRAGVDPDDPKDYKSSYQGWNEVPVSAQVTLDSSKATALVCCLPPGYNTISEWLSNYGSDENKKNIIREKMRKYKNLSPGWAAKEIVFAKTYTLDGGTTYQMYFGNDILDMNCLDLGDNCKINKNGSWTA